MRFRPDLFGGGVDPKPKGAPIPVDPIQERFKQRLLREGLMRQGVPVFNPPPARQTFKTQDEHNRFYVQQLLNHTKNADPDKYELYHQKLNAGDKDGALSVLALLGAKFPDLEVPQFAPTPKPVVEVGRSRILDIGVGIPSVGGYRYNAGPGLPARGSITNRRRRRRPL